MTDEIHVVCTEQKRLTEMETTLKFLREDTLKRHEEKLDRICSLLENGLVAKVSRNMESIDTIKTDVHALKKAYLERPTDDKGEPVDRRLHPYDQDPYKPLKQKWSDMAWWKKIPVIGGIIAIVFQDWFRELIKQLVGYYMK